MITARKAMMFVVFIGLVAFLLQGCALMDKITGKKTVEPEEKTAETGVPPETAPDAEAGTAETETAEPAPEAWVRVTSPENDAAGVDTKLPVAWWVDENAGKVTMIGVNIFECGADGTMPSGAQAVVAYKMMNNAVLEMREWIFFAEDVEKNWLFTGSHEGMTELKPNTKYLMNFVVSTETGKTETVQVYFTTK